MQTVKPKKFLGQHFLKDLRVAEAIADTVDACPDIPILEVGPGMGVLTQFLMPKGREVKVVEIDRESVAYLRGTPLAPGAGGTDTSLYQGSIAAEHSTPPAQRGGEDDWIIEADFLKMDLSEVFGGRQFVLTGNYPYNISSQIFFKMLDFKDLIPCCTGMIQKEVAERLAAHPGTKAFGILSVLIQLWYDVEYLFTVPPGVFNPPPKVQSAVIRMTRNDVSDPGCDVRLLTRIVKQAFQQRRKMLRGSLKGLIPADHPFGTLRPEQLSVAQFVQLTNDIAQNQQDA